MKIRLIGLFGLSLILLAPMAGTAKMVRDQLGREMTVPDAPQRIVALAPSITEIVFALDQGERLKGATRFSNYPAQAQNLPKVGTYVHLDLEKIVSLKPDLCIAIKDGNPREVATRLESLGIPVYAVDPRGLETVMGTLLELGDLLNASQKARALVRQMRARIAGVKEKVARVSQRPGVFFQIGISPIVSVGANTFIHELITTAGGVNLAAGAENAYPRFSKEAVIALKPEVLIITSMARGQDFERIKGQWRQWKRIPAVKHQRVHVVDSDLFDRPSPRLVNGLALLARLIHPQLFPKAP